MIESTEVETIKGQKQGLNLFPFSKKELTHRGRNYYEGVETLQQFLIDEFEVRDTADLVWFNAMHQFGQSEIDIAQNLVEYVYSPRAVSNNDDMRLSVYQVSPDASYVVVLNWYDRYRYTYTDPPASHGFGHENKLCNNAFHIRSILRDGLSKKEAIDLVRRLNKQHIDGKKAAVAALIHDKLGEPCKGTIGIHNDNQVIPLIGDLVVKYGYGIRDQGWIYQIVAEIETEDRYVRLKNKKKSYVYKICPVFCGFRQGHAPNRETVRSDQLSVVDLPDLCQKLSLLNRLIEENIAIKSGLK